MSVANKGALDLRVHVEWKKHKKVVAGEMSSAKVTSFLLHQEAYQIILY
jgi:hypothetical protein